MKIGKLKEEPATRSEYTGLVASGKKRLQDARNRALSTEGRFDLAYNACHALALAALRRKGYRPAHRFIVFQTLEETLRLRPEIWRVLDKAQDTRDLNEYQGHTDIDEHLLAALLDCAAILMDEVMLLTPPQ